MLKSTMLDPQLRATAQDAWHIPPRDHRPLGETYAWEERRLAAMRAGLCGPMAYAWVPARSLSISKAEARRINLDALDFTAEPVAIRGSGGTVVPQGIGTTNITLFTRHRRHPGIRPFYDDLCAALQTAFHTLDLPTTIGPCAGSFCDGDYNLQLDGKKLVGTAQRWTRAKDGSTLGHHHCVVMLGADPTELCARTDALYAAANLPDRANPSVHSGTPIDLTELRAALKDPLDALLRISNHK
jgi:lipoate-protein ligase A